MSTSTLGSPLTTTCIPSLVTLNIRPMSIAVSRVRPLLFSRHRCLTCSFTDSHAIALRINLPVSATFSPLASAFRSVTKLPKVSQGCCRLRSNWTAPMMGFFLVSGCVLNFPTLRSSISFSLTFWQFSPVPNCTISHWKVKYIFSSLVTDEAHQIADFSFLKAFTEWPAEGKLAMLVEPFPLLA